MKDFVWLFPILFMLHDMEEIIGFSGWIQRNIEMLQKRYYKIYKTYEYCSTEGMALAILEEYIICIIISIIAIKMDFYYLWIGGFIAYTLHLFIHILQSIVIRKYIPALASSIVCLPISIYIIIKCINIISAPMYMLIIFSIIGIIIVYLNLKIAHLIMNKYTKWLITSVE